MTEEEGGGGVWFWTHKFEFEIRHPHGDVQQSRVWSLDKRSALEINFGLVRIA